MLLILIWPNLKAGTARARDEKITNTELSAERIETISTDTTLWSRPYTLYVHFMVTWLICLSKVIEHTYSHIGVIHAQYNPCAFMHDYRCDLCRTLAPLHTPVHQASPALDQRRGQPWPTATRPRLSPLAWLRSLETRRDWHSDRGHSPSCPATLPYSRHWRHCTVQNAAQFWRI